MKKFFEIEDKFNLAEQVEVTKTKYNEYFNFIMNYLLTNENYKNNKIFKINVIPPEPEVIDENSEQANVSSPSHVK